MTLQQTIHSALLMIAATALEVCGDKLIRSSMYNHAGAARVGLIVMGAVLLFGYGFFLNLAPVAFGKIVGLYITTLFIMWQAITYLTTKSIPTMPMIVGGSLIVAGGLIVTFWGNE